MKITNQKYLFLVLAAALAGSTAQAAWYSNSSDFKSMLSGNKDFISEKIKDVAKSANATLKNDWHKSNGRKAVILGAATASVVVPTLIYYRYFKKNVKPVNLDKVVKSPQDKK